MSERRRLAAGGVVVLGLAGLVGWLSRLPAEPAAVAIEATGPVEAVEAALAAWGRFAVTGDLGLVAETFDLAGPQYRQLAAEAPRLAADPAGEPPYEFSVEVLEVRDGPVESVVEARVTMSRPGEQSSRFDWDLVMRPVEGRWLLWTVEARG